MSVVIGIVWGFVKQFWPYILGALLIWYGWHRLDEWCNGACVDQKATVAKTAGELKQAQAVLQKLDTERIAQQEAWAKSTAFEEQRERQQEQDRKLAFAGRADAARASVALRGISVPRTSLDGLRDAYAAAEPAPAPSKPTEAPAADPTAAALVGWSVDVLEWANECRSRVDAWTAWYQSLRSANVVAP